MKPVFAAPREMLDRKPPHGQACNRCGLCCVATLCDVAQHVFKREALPGPCPALRRNDDGVTHRCGLIEACGPAVEMKAAVELLIGSGQGCDARFNGEPADQAFYKRLEEFDAANRDALNAARRLLRMRDQSN